MSMREKPPIYRLAAAGVLGALVFVSNYISIPIPVAIGDVSRIHLANGLCILSGLLLGPVSGGLAAGIGSALFDLLNPVYITSAPFTFLFKLVLAMLPGIFVRFNKPVMTIVGCVLGQLAYIALYITKSYVFGLLEGNAPDALIPVMITKLGTSSINGVVAVIISAILFSGVRAALKKNKFSFT